MAMHVDAADPSLSEFDPEEERALIERLKAAGYRMPTRSLDRPRQLAKRRPAWLAFLFSLLRAKGR